MYIMYFAFHYIRSGKELKYRMFMKFISYS